MLTVITAVLLLCWRETTPSHLARLDATNVRLPGRTVRYRVPEDSLFMTLGRIRLRPGPPSREGSASAAGKARPTWLRALGQLVHSATASDGIY